MEEWYIVEPRVGWSEQRIGVLQHVLAVDEGRKLDKTVQPLRSRAKTLARLVGRTSIYGAI